MHANPRHSIPLELRAKTELAVKAIVYDAIEKRRATE